MRRFEKLIIHGYVLIALALAARALTEFVVYRHDVSALLLKQDEILYALYQLQAAL